MNAFVLSSLLAVVSNFFMCLFVLFNSKDKSKFLWSLLAFFAGIWGLGSFIATVRLDKDMAYIGWTIANITSILGPVLYAHFVCNYTNTRTPCFLKISYFVAGFYLLFMFLFNRLYLGSLRLSFGQFYYIDFSFSENPLYLLCYIFFYWGVLPYGFYLLIKYYQQAQSERKTQARYLLLGSTIGWLGAHGDYLSVFLPRLYPYANFFIALYPLIMGYAMLKHSWLDISIVLKKGLVYSAMVAVITGLYFLFVLGIGSVFQEFLGYQSFLLNAAIVFAIALLFNPIRASVQSLLDKKLFHGTLESLEREKDRLQQELFHAEKLAYVGQLASSVVHEIRNPLTSIKTYLEYLPQKYDDQEFRNRINDLIPREIGRVEKMVSQLLGLAKDQPLNLVDVKLEEIIRETVQLLENHFKIKDIQVRLEIEESIYPIKGDRDQLKQVFLNLFLNAIQAMEPGGQLEITQYTVDRMVTVLVKDNGCGMSEATLDTLFTPFRTTKENGIGLGLSITKEIIEQHHGKITVTSKQGEGTTFQLDFPLGIK